MMGYQLSGVRFTHIPTGITAQSTGRGNYHRNMKRYHAAAMGLLLARLCRPPQAPIRRTYDLSPPLGIEPNIRQDGRWIVVGGEAVQSVLRGDLDPLITATPAS